MQACRDLQSALEHCEQEKGEANKAASRCQEQLAFAQTEAEVGSSAHVMQFSYPVSTIIASGCQIMGPPAAEGLPNQITRNQVGQTLDSTSAYVSKLLTRAMGDFLLGKLRWRAWNANAHTA